ncbi:MAG TPA: hypothetical protein VMB23_02610 [Spirochaetia bacterium]|jgi:hypothetical protein|nr:hypothetical protein [Spirochaetia bacterium]
MMANLDRLEYAHALACALAGEPWESIGSSTKVPDPLAFERTLRLKGQNDAFRAVAALGEVPRILVLAMGADEVQWVKQAWAAGLRAAAVPQFPRPSSALGLHPGKWPDLGAVMAGSVFARVAVPGFESLGEAHRACDCAWFACLVRAAEDLGDADLIRFVRWENLSAARVFQARSVPVEAQAEEALLVRSQTLFRSRPGSVAGLYGYVRWRYAEARRRIRWAQARRREGL